MTCDFCHSTNLILHNHLNNALCIKCGADWGITLYLIQPPREDYDLIKVREKEVIKSKPRNKKIVFVLPEA